MQVSVEAIGSLERQLTISVPGDSFELKVDERLKEAAPKLKVKGFRPGKVPMKEVRRRFGGSVRQEVASELMQASFVEAVQQEDLTPAGAPALEIVNMDSGADLEFKATFEVFPTIEVADLSAARIVDPQATITDEDVASMVDKLREQRKTFEAVDRGAEEGDQVTVDFQGRLDGEPFDGGQGEGVSFVIGEGRMLPDFETAVTGAKTDETVEATVHFPDDYNAEVLQGKDAEFSIEIKVVEAATLPELDNEFFESFGVTEGGEEAFLVEIRDNMQSEMDAAAQGQVKRQVLDELARLHEVELPQALVQREIETVKSQMLQRFQLPTGRDLPNLPDDMFRGEAEKRVHVGLVVNEIVNSAELTPDADKVRERIEQLAKPYDQPEQVVNWYYSDEAQLQQVEMAVLEDQVVDHVLAGAGVEQLETTYDDVISGVATSPPEEPPEEPAEEPAGEQASADDAVAASAEDNRASDEPAGDAPADEDDSSATADDQKEA